MGSAINLLVTAIFAAAAVSAALGVRYLLAALAVWPHIKPGQGGAYLWALGWGRIEAAGAYVAPEGAAAHATLVARYRIARSATLWTVAAVFAVIGGLIGGEAAGFWSLPLEN